MPIRYGKQGFWIDMLSKCLSRDCVLQPDSGNVSRGWAIWELPSWQSGAGSGDIMHSRAVSSTCVLQYGDRKLHNDWSVGRMSCKCRAAGRDNVYDGIVSDRGVL